MNHYDALGVPDTAGVEEIHKAYLAAARRHHPDFHAEDDPTSRRAHAERMQAVNQAWEVLGHPDARADYDVALRSVEPPRRREHPGHDAQPPPGKGWTPRPDDDGWQQDFEAWADDRDILAPDEPAARRRTGLTVVPVVLFAVGVSAGLLGVVLTSRPLVALCVAAMSISAALFLVLPLLEMTRGSARAASGGPPTGRGHEGRAPKAINPGSAASPGSEAAPATSSGHRGARIGGSRPRGRGHRSGTVTR